MRSKAKTENLDWSGLITGLVELLVGILLLIDPIGFTSGIIIAVGAALCLIGLKSVITYFRSDAFNAAASQSLSKGLIYLFIGGFCAFKSEWFIVTFPILTLLYGAIMLLAGLGKIQFMADMIRMKSKRWWLAAISAALTLLCAVIILLDPFGVTAALWIFTAVTLIVQAVLDCVTIFLSRAANNEISDS